MELYKHNNASPFVKYYAKCFFMPNCWERWRIDVPFFTYSRNILKRKDNYEQYSTYALVLLSQTVPNRSNLAIRIRTVVSEGAWFRWKLEQICCSCCSNFHYFGYRFSLLKHVVQSYNVLCMGKPGICPPGVVKKKCLLVTPM